MSRSIEGLRGKVAVAGLVGAAALGGFAYSESTGPAFADGTSPSPITEVIGQNGEIRLSGFPESVDRSVVDVAKGEFKSTVGAFKAFAAEPGGLLVGPDFGSKSDKNPYGENPKGWDAMYGSEGHIKAMSPVNMEVLHYEGPFAQNLPEGGFAIFTFGQGALEFGNDNQYRMELPHQEGNTYFVVVRGYYGDNKQNTDRNDTVRVTDYVPGHALAMMYEAGDDTNTAFVSEGQVEQMLETIHSSGTNTGDGGSSRATIVYADANTGAYDIAVQDEARFQGGNANVNLVQSNWR